MSVTSTVLTSSFIPLLPGRPSNAEEVQHAECCLGISHCSVTWLKSKLKQRIAWSGWGCAEAPRPCAQAQRAPQLVSIFIDIRRERRLHREWVAMAAVINLPARTPIALGNRCYVGRVDTNLRQLRHRRNCPAISSFRSHKPPASISPCTPLAPRGRAKTKIHAGAAGAAQPSLPEETPKAESGPVAKFKALLSPFSEPSTNKKLLALCGAQALSSVATLIHDTYLPLYLSEELKLSNTKVSVLTSFYHCTLLVYAPRHSFL